tara:strand:+ start:1067 stop:3049 length:1983 start_codon:yes stop_codon:yes gene_type:complete
MNLDKQKKQKDPAEEDIKFILSLLSSRKFEEAKKKIDKQIVNFPNSSILFNILGAIFAEQNQATKAIENYKKAININPNYAQAYNNLGIAFHKINNLDEAIENYKKALKLKNNFAEALNNLGSALKDLKKYKESISYFEKSIQLKENYAEAFNGLASVYEEVRDNEKAIENYKIALKINPNFSEAYNNLGSLYSNLVMFDKSLICYEKAIEVNPNNEKAYNNLGNLLNDLGRYNDATEAYNNAIKLKPNYSRAYSNLLLNLNYKIDFNPEHYLSKAKEFRLNCGFKKKLNLNYQYKKNPDKLKIGMISADFGDHPGGFFSLSVLRELRKKNFDLIAYSALDRNDEFSSHFRPLFSKWHSIKNKKDEEVVKQIISDGIHILMELQGHSAENRIPIFTFKAAPIQVSWLSQGSNGVPEIDYLVGSPYITPQDEEKHFVEKIWRLPDITQCFTSPNFEIKVNELPALKNNFVTFGCINKLNKINDDVIKLWSKVLISVPNSKLLLKTKNLGNKLVCNNILDKFKKNNIDKKRLILLGESKTRKEVLQIYNKIDICLDPFPFQGNTSTCEAIWMGVPVITLKGNRFLFHFGESINANLGMQDWIANNNDKYVDIAIKFSSNLNQLSLIRKELRDKALKSPVFDHEKLANHFSKMLWGMWKEFSK